MRWAGVDSVHAFFRVVARSEELERRRAVDAAAIIVVANDVSSRPLAASAWAQAAEPIFGAHNRITRGMAADYPGSERFEKYLSSMARPLQLRFVVLARERFDIVIGQCRYFEAPFQALFEFARGDRFRRHPDELGGYDLAKAGRVVYVGP